MSATQPAARSPWSDLRRRLRDETGASLVMSLLVTLSLGTSIAGGLSWVTSNQTSSTDTAHVGQASELAAGGLSRDFSILTSAANPLDASLLPSSSVTGPTGTTTYWGTLNGYVWTVYGRGTVRPTEPGLRVPARIATAKVQVTSVPDLSVWNVLYSDAKTGCMQIQNNATLRTSLYVAGNLCVNNNAALVGATSTLEVAGTLTVGNNGYVGTGAQPLPKALVAGGCGADHHVCGTSDLVWATQTGKVFSPITKPPVDLAYWRANAPLGPTHPCTVGSLPSGVTFTGPTVDLFPKSKDYDCKALDGQGKTIAELGWNHTSKTFTISGTAFFDGNISESNNVVATYSGQATIYSAGTVTLSNNVFICATSNCGMPWDPSKNLLIWVAGSSVASTGITLSNNAVFQGGGYAVDDIDFSNNGTFIGPGIARQLYVSNNAYFPPIVSLPPGAPVGSGYSVAIVPGSFN